MERLVRLAPAACAAAALALLAPHAAAQCISGGAGGAIPGSTAVDGTWPTVLPTDPLISPLPVTVPSGATVVNAVKLYGLSHTWIGDMQIVLEDPSGGLHNVFHGTDGMGGGCSDDAAGDYVFIDPLSGAGCGGPTVPPCGAGTIPPGTYLQDFGTWPSGSVGIDNTPLESIPIASGTWTLYIYDWLVAADSGTLTSWELCFGAPTPPPTGGGGPSCSTGGAGGSFPIGGVDGTWSTTLPTGELVAPLAVTLPPGATKVVSVKLHGLNHTWCGDCQIVLQAPNGTSYNLFQEVDGVYGGGCSDAFAGDYTFLDAGAVADPCGAPALSFLCGSGSVPAGSYQQYFGAWPDGDSGIHNTPLESIPVASGTWTLVIYDWFVAADNGTLTSWDLCFDSSGTPVAFCTPTAPGTSHGCIPTIEATGHPDVAHSTPCLISVESVEGQQTGILFYGVSGTMNVPWCAIGSQSFLCVKSPIWRVGVQNSGGTYGACDGALVFDWSAYQLANPGALGNPWSAGDQAQVQGWFRDPPSCKTTFLSEALTLIYQP